MKKVLFSYNPFTVESKFFIDDILLESGKLCALQNTRLQMWIDELFPLLATECNDDIQFTFKGTDLDYEDVAFAADEYRKNGGCITISMQSPMLGKGAKDRINDLVNLFQYLQNECPFADLRTEQVKENFAKAIGSEFEVSVIATMSSGKSTLINAMLGKELMPAKNEACTATIARIKDVDGKGNFSAICLDAEGKELTKCNNLTADIMDTFNNDPQVSYVEIEGDIPFVSSENMQLVLLDTPGPNNSRNEEHRNHTYRIIKEKSKPMVLYVLNATQLSTNDDNALLTAVSEAMKVGGKQSKDRFIFAVNKMDTFDVEKGDSVDKALKNVTEYLAKHGIEQPNIYPVSAEIAKVIRINENGAELSRRQRRTLADSTELLEVPQMHLEEYAPLSNQSRNILQNELEESINSQSKYAATLIHSGLPAVEIAINEYLDKYALTNKVKTAVDTFAKKIEEKQLVNSLALEMKDSSEKRAEIQRRLKYIQKQLADGEKAKDFKQRIQDLDISKDAEMKIRTIRGKITKVLDSQHGVIQEGTQMSRLDVERLMMDAQRQVNDLQSSVKADLENIIDELVKGNAQQIIGEYEQHVATLLNNKELAIGDFNFSTTLKILTTDIPDASSLINKYREVQTVREKVGEEWVENTNKKWYKFWTWFDESGHYKDVYESRSYEYVDGKKVVSDFFGPIKRNFNDNLENAKTEAMKQTEEFKKFFMNELDKLDALLKNKVAELQKVSADQDSIEQKIKDDEQRIAWLDDFMNRLNAILKI